MLERKGKEIRKASQVACVVLIIGLLLSGCASVPARNEGIYTTITTYSFATDTEKVWIPRTGKRYHRNKSCSGMESPRVVTVEEAIGYGFSSCGNCY